MSSPKKETLILEVKKRSYPGSNRGYGKATSLNPV